MVTHNREIAALADRIILLDDGRINGTKRGYPADADAEIHSA